MAYQYQVWVNEPDELEVGASGTRQDPPGPTGHGETRHFPFQLSLADPQPSQGRVCAGKQSKHDEPQMREKRKRKAGLLMLSVSRQR